MGKKRVIEATEEELLKETEKRESVEKKAINRSAKAQAKQAASGCAYIQSTYNNTIITITNNKGNILTWASAGSVGFKGPKKATPYAASRVAESLMEKINRIGLKELSVYIKGVGSGRDSAIRSFAAQGLEINMIKDVTPIPHNGCRPPKPRRV